ncbi:hypothetical protein [Rubrobacter indicoceani]|uniref:hypothetical protein n=1 Tax=Rubrobacter indicoceani TaxID=2051957 RepID=UPI001F09E69C|nr:hypothetical protein [Rubrobacter indicoceani]
MLQVVLEAKPPRAVRFKEAVVAAQEVAALARLDVQKVYLELLHLLVDVGGPLLALKVHGEDLVGLEDHEPDKQKLQQKEQQKGEREPGSSRFETPG